MDAGDRERRVLERVEGVIAEPTVKEDITASPKKTTRDMEFKTPAPSRRVFSPAWLKNAPSAGVRLANAFLVE